MQGFHSTLNNARNIVVLTGDLSIVAGLKPFWYRLTPPLLYKPCLGACVEVLARQRSLASPLSEVPEGSGESLMPLLLVCLQGVSELTHHK